ncbi:MAG: tRNA lysidine(34) synthetase TilS [Planctomycetaceae bacterium]|nr:tRNA lysidine(34) synthetase TilS [Planctomycetaceae bacterium]
MTRPHTSHIVRRMDSSPDQSAFENLADDAFIAALQHNYQQCGLTKGSVLLAVSGGLDSVVLLHATSQLLRQGPLAVVHVNHQLRGTDSDRDETFVRQQCAGLQIPCYVSTIDVRAANQEHSGETLEETARRLRYAAIVQVANELKAACVVTAHHQDDQAETVLHNILRGTGLRGLCGMPRQRLLSENIALIRPMLEFSRRQIEDWAQQHSLQWRDDHTNRDPSFTRNRLRHHLLPLLVRNYNTQAVSHLADLGGHASELLGCMDELAQRVLDEAVLHRTPSAIRLDCHALQSWPTLLLRHSFILLWKQQHWPRQKMNRTHWYRLETACRQTEDAASDRSHRCDLPAGIRCERRGNLLMLQKPVSNTDKNP